MRLSSVCTRLGLVRRSPLVDCLPAGPRFLGALGPVFGLDPRGGPVDDAGIERFEIRVRLDASVCVNGQDWLKPGVETAVRWSGLPSAQEQADAVEFMQREVVAPVIAQVMELVDERVDALRAAR